MRIINNETACLPPIIGELFGQSDESASPLRKVMFTAELSFWPLKKRVSPGKRVCERSGTPSFPIVIPADLATQTVPMQVSQSVSVVKEKEKLPRFGVWTTEGSP